MDPTLVPSTWFESQFQICVYEHAILRIYISFFLSQCPWQERKLFVVLLIRNNKIHSGTKIDILKYCFYNQN